MMSTSTAVEAHKKAEAGECEYAQAWRMYRVGTTQQDSGLSVSAANEVSLISDVLGRADVSTSRQGNRGIAPGARQQTHSPWMACNWQRPDSLWVALKFLNRKGGFWCTLTVLK